MTRASRPHIGAALRQAWVGYRRQLDEELAKAGFGDRGFPDGRVLNICSRTPDVTISFVGRQLGMTRQGASKLVGSLRERGYVTLRPSEADAREKIVTLTPRATRFMQVQEQAAQRIERRLASELGTESMDALWRLTEMLGGADQPRLRDYVAESQGRGGRAPR